MHSELSWLYLNWCKNVVTANLSGGDVTLHFKCVALLVRIVSWGLIPNLEACWVTGPSEPRSELSSFWKQPLGPWCIYLPCILTGTFPILVSPNYLQMKLFFPQFLKGFLLPFTTEKHMGNLNNCKPREITKLPRIHIFFKTITNEKTHP